MIELKNTNTCCGCGGCANVCKHDAITMKPDKEGFLYPKVDKSKCVGCGLCEAVCPFLSDNLAKKPLSVYAVMHNDEEVRIKSSSGGFFSSLMQYVIEQGGVVYGAVFDKDFNVIHTKAETHDDCKELRGSKYVQSLIGNIYRDVLCELRNKRLVLFSGTPCQVSTLIKIAGNKRENLVTCDILCHGVPSPLVWQDYLKTLSKSPSAIYFRDKADGWHSPKVCIQIGDDQIVSESHATNDYSQMYFKHLSLRPSCARCPFACIERVGDFSMGDFWGIEKTDAIIDDNKGVSLVFENTEKAHDLFNELRKNLYVKPKLIEECLQPILEGPSALSEERELFWMCYRSLGFNKTKTIFLDKYIPSTMTRIEYKIIKQLYKIRRKIIKLYDRDN